MAHGRSHYFQYLRNATSVFERLELCMVEWVHLNRNKQTSPKTGNLSQLCEYITRVSVDNYFFPSINIFENIVKIIWWKNNYDWIWNKIAVMFINYISTFLVSFLNEFLYFVCILLLVVLQ